MAHESKDDGDDDIRAVTELLLSGLEIKERTYWFKTYPMCFVGDEAVKFLISHDTAKDVDEAVAILQKLESKGLFKHVTGDHAFKNDGYFYRFAVHEDGPRGKKPHKAEGGTAVSWGDFFPAGSAVDAAPAKVKLEGGADLEFHDISVTPFDEHNIKLLDNVHPASWIDPTPDGNYNMVVIGAGAGGLVTAISCAGIGAKVALIEEHLLGGDCLNVGCVPSKALIKAANRVHEVKTAHELGVNVAGFSVDFPKIMERMRKLRAGISPHDSAERYTKAGVDVFIGRGKFTGTNKVEVNGKTLTFSRATIATGGSAFVPPYPGLKVVPYLTNASIFNLTELPPRMGVIGSGPIGLELAQAFQRFGTKVTVFVRGDRILSKEDPDAAEILKKQLVADGVEFVYHATITGVSGGAASEDKAAYKKRTPITVSVNSGAAGAGGDVEVMYAVDELLIAAGRQANVTNMGLEAARVELTPDGKLIKINDTLQTTNSDVYAVGDCCGNEQFTHAADFMARTVVRNALFFSSGKYSSLIIPRATYTEPEIAHVGLSLQELAKSKVEFDTYTRWMKDVDRAILDGETDGFVKFICKKGTDELLGCTIVAPQAGNMISEVTVALQNKIGIGRLAASIHPYPTQAEAIRQAGDLFNKTKLTPTTKTLLRSITAWRR